MKKGRWYLHPLMIAVWVIVGLFIIISLVPFGKPGEDGLKLQAGSIKSNSSLSTGCTTSGNEYSFFPARRILVINRSEHPLMAGVATRLVERLEKLDFVDKVDLCGPGERPDTGTCLYDLYVLLELPSIDVHGLLATGRTVEADVKVSCGRNIFNSDHVYIDDYASLYAGISMTSLLRHESVAHGYESADARFVQEIEAVEAQVGGALEKNLSAWSAKYVDVNRLPPALIPGYVPVPPDLPLPLNESLEMVISGNRPLLHNQSVWAMETSVPSEILGEWLDAAKRAGWTLSPDTVNDKNRFLYFRATKGNDLIEAYKTQDDDPRREGDGAGRLVFSYCDRMEPEELTPLLNAMVSDESVPVETLLCFFRKFTEEQQAALLARWKDQTQLPFEAQRRVIRHLWSEGDADEAKARLCKLYAVNLFEDNDRINEIRKLGREIMNDDQWEPVTPTIDELKAFGFVVVTSNAVLEVDLRQHLGFLMKGRADEEASLVDVLIEPSTIPEGLYTLHVGAQMSDLSSGKCVNSNTPHTREHPWRCMSHVGMNGSGCSIEAHEISTNRFSLTVQRY
ncbi:MAG: hypothetical protein JXR25_05665 [Pontiellaceae bacterium]|nr:hypothetical protein [Pontiellaceae bacterium]MBN2784294.1 hypothetical protein [Pontiellaceae bacterium]